MTNGNETESPGVIEKLRARADRWQPWIDDDIEAEMGYLPEHMRYHQKLDRDAADEIERLRGWLEAIKYRSHGHGLAMLMANDALRGCVVPDPSRSSDTRRAPNFSTEKNDGT